MSELSPAAQAVLIVCNAAVERLPFTAKPEQFSIALIAAALRAAADNLTPKTIGAVRIVYELLSIADELENHV